MAIDSSSMAVVTTVGVDSTTNANWRTSAALEADGEYGTLGYVVWGLDLPDNTYVGSADLSDPGSGNVYALPATVTVSSAITATGIWSGNAANFGTMEDPGNGNAITNTPLIANVVGANQFTISRAASSAYRITLMAASGDNQGTEFTITMNDGSGPQQTVYDHPANGLAYHVFDVSDGTSDIVIDVVSAVENRSLTGIAFDAYVPEPSSAILLALGSLSLVRRRRG